MKKKVNRKEYAFVRGFAKLGKTAKIGALKMIRPKQVGYLVSFLRRVGKQKDVMSKVFESVSGGANKRQLYKKKFKSLTRRKLNCKKLCCKIKTQRGGFWGVLLATVLPIVVDLIYKQFSKST
jgi:hypothetical protein